MAMNLARGGFRTTVWNRTGEKAASLATHGCTVAESAEKAVGEADVVISMLDSAAATDAVFFSGTAPAVQCMRAGTVLVVMSSLAPGESREHARRCAAYGVRYVDAPVSGGPEGAVEASLAIMAGGSEEDFLRIEPVLQAMGRPTLIGPVGCGQLAKLANQAIVANTIVAVTEALMLAESGGADPAKVRAALAGGLADSKILQLHGKRMIERDFTVRGSVNNQLKDLENILAEARRSNLLLPISERVGEIYRRLVQDGHGALDHSAAWLELERHNSSQHREE